MLAALILAVAIDWNTPKYSVEGNAYTNGGFVAGVGVNKRKRPEPKPRDKLNPVEAWHKFCRPDGKVEIPKDTRPKPYKREKPNPHKRKPRK